MNDMALRAMQFAKQAHSKQVRKYTGEGYWLHLAEVAGIVAPVQPDKESIAIAWLHDTIEDTSVTFEDLRTEFGQYVAWGVQQLTEDVQGNRATRKEAMRQRLGAAPGEIQTIKVADIMSNTASICLHDPDFAKVYTKEALALLGVLSKAHPIVRLMAVGQIQAYLGHLQSDTP